MIEVAKIDEWSGLYGRVLGGYIYFKGRQQPSTMGSTE